MRTPKPPPSPSDAEWLAHVEAHARSGLSVLEYARQHGLKADTLYKRRRRLATARLVPIAVETAAPCELAFPDGLVLRFPATLAPDALRGFVLAVSPR